MAGFLNFTKDKQINKVIEIDVSLIVPNPHQPRTEFDDSDIRSLAESIGQNGILQPLSVRKSGEKYELIAGERRLRAAKMCGLQAVPCIVHDLSFFDEAAAIEKLISYYGMTQEDAASKLGKAQSTIANKLRLLRLTPEERELIVGFNLTERHARALLKLGSCEERINILEKVIKNKLNVERTEKLVEDYIGQKKVRQSYRTRSKVFQNVKIFVNTINKAIETMQSAGIDADSKKIQNEEYIEYRVRIPIENSREADLLFNKHEH